MEARVNEFGDCTGNETEKIENDPEQFDLLDLPFEKCKKIKFEEMEKVMIEDGCWKAVAVVKQRCRQLQKCCPAAKICMKSGRNSDATKEVRQKHIEINRKTLECRNNMKKLLDEQKKNGKGFNELLNARAHAVLTAQGDTLMDAIQKKYVFNKKERHEMRIMRKELNPSKSVVSLSPPSSNSSTTNFVAPKNNNPIRHLAKQSIQKIILKNNRKPKVKKGRKQTPNNNPLILFNAPSVPDNVKHLGRPPSQMLNTIKPHLPTTITTHSSTPPAMKGNRLQQFEEFENMLHTLENDGTKKFGVKIVTPKKHPNIQSLINSKNTSPKTAIKNNVFPTESQIRNGFIPRFKSINQPQSFALPPTVNLTKMNMFEARPELKIQMRKSFKNINNILGKPGLEKSQTLRPRIQSIQTQTDFDKPIMNIFKIDQDLVPFNNKELSPEAFVGHDGMWTLSPEALTTPAKSFVENDKASLHQQSFSDNEKKEFEQKQLKSSMPSNIVIFNNQENPMPTVSEFSAETPSILRTTMKAPIQEFLKILKPVIAPKIKMTEADESEMLVVKEDLIKNLEQFVKNNAKKQNEKQKLSIESSRIEMLRTSQEEFKAEQISMDYCKLYTVCSEEQKYVSKSCEGNNGKLIPGLPRRRFGKCNKRLVTDYKRMNSMKQKVERLFEKCLSDKIALNDASSISETCPKEWPILPEFEQEATCIHRVRLVQNHCAKLSRCCTAAQDCRLSVDEMPVSWKLIQKEEAVAKASAKCQIKAYNDYLKYKTKRFGDVKVEKRGGSKNDIRFGSNRNHASKTSPSIQIQSTTITTTPKPLQLFTTRIPASSKKSLPNRVFPEIIHVGTFQPQSQSIQIPDEKLSGLNRIDTSHVKLLWE
uniref:Uncharacterized protein n=1 Tax=Panagrolaimus superbus TaxID=310955 RepID=A0A914YKL7_9BILA